MVGSPSKQLESSRTEESDKKTSVEQDISEYLLLHHNYAKTQPKEVTTPRRKTSTTTRKLKTIKPKIHADTKSKLAIKSGLSVPVQPKNTTLKLQENSSNNELIFGTFDENTNTITILVNDDSVPLNEVIVGENVICSSEVDTNIPVTVDTSNSLSVPLASEGNSSPRPDLRYGSLNSSRY